MVGDIKHEKWIGVLVMNLIIVAVIIILCHDIASGTANRIMSNCSSNPKVFISVPDLVISAGLTIIYSLEVFNELLTEDYIHSTAHCTGNL